MSKDEETAAANTTTSDTATNTTNDAPAGQNGAAEVQPASSRSSRRRSGRTAQHHDPIIAPGFGTRRDLEKLAQQLSEGTNTSLPVEAVRAMMESRGRGIRKSRSAASAEEQETAAAAATTATPVSSAWADFMKEEGVTTTTDTNEDTTATGKRGRAAKNKNDGGSTVGMMATAAGGATSTRDYILPNQTNKEKKANDDEGGILVQTGTLDVGVVGRSKAKMDVDAMFNLFAPTRLLLPGNNIKIRTVVTAGHACHSLAISTNGACYGWGRNEQKQLGSTGLGGDDDDDEPLPTNVYQPTLLRINATDGEENPAVQSAAVGKSHTILILENGSVLAAGSNKLGQCGVKSNTDQVSTFKPCVFPDDMESTIVQVACGEEFSVAICDSGYMYTTGLSQYGQLANGETGEYIVAANKIGFANQTSFLKRTTFCHAPGEKLHLSSGEKTKAVPLSEDIRIQQVACGKHHGLALEAESENGLLPRVFTWGCGDYGVLGHGVQADEYYPRVVGVLANLRLPQTGGSHISVSAGQHCSLFQTVHGHVYYWGKHRSVGEATMRPTLVDALANNQHVVTQAAAGGQTVVCCTANAQTVAWGQGSYGELGLGTSQKSSAKPMFVPGLDSCRISSLACGYGHTLFVVMDEDNEDRQAIAKLPELDPDATEDLAAAAAAAVEASNAQAPSKPGKRKK